jgi:hypothetical protein
MNLMWDILKLYVLLHLHNIYHYVYYRYIIIVDLQIKVIHSFVFFAVNSYQPVYIYVCVSDHLT